MEITGGSELRWMQYVEPNQFTGNIQERLVLKSSDGIHAYDADFGFKLIVSRMVEKDGPQGRKYYEVINDVTATASIFVIRKQQHMVNGKFSGTFISPDYNVCPYSVNHTAYSKYHALYCEDEPRYCFGMISSIKPVLTRVMGQIVRDGRPSAGNNPSADGLRVGNGNWFQRDILKLQAFGADGMANQPIYLDVYYGIALNTFGEFIQQNSLGEVYRGFRFKLIYPSMQGETVKVSQSSENDGAPKELVLKLIHHHIASDIAQDASAADASLTPQEVENSLASDLLERNENFVQEIRVMTFLDLVTRPKHPFKVKIGQEGGMLPNYRHMITDMIPDLDIREHPDYEHLPTFHRHHTLTRAHGRFLLFASDCYPHKCLLKFTQSYRQQFYFTELEVLYVFRQVLCSLAVMHRHGIAHQDISSENVLLKAVHHSGPIAIRRDEPYPLLSMLCILMDYGQAFAVPYTMDEVGNIEYNTKVPLNTTKRQPVGKFAFHAPELIAIFSKLKAWRNIHGSHLQLDDEQKAQLVYDPFAVDVFQLGIFLFIMIFRIYPFTTRGSVERSQRQFFESLKDKTFFTLSIPQMIESYQVSKPSMECLDLLQRLLAVNPDERPRVSQILTHPWVQQHRPELPSPPILITNPSLLYTMNLEPTPSLPLQMVVPFSSNFFEGDDLNTINTTPQEAVDEA